MAEGSTDYPFLKPIIEKSLSEIAYNEIEKEIEILVFDIDYGKEGGFSNFVLSASKTGINKYGIMCLVIHSDADALTPEFAYNERINPAIRYLHAQKDEILCKEIVPLVPVYETESWMLANKELLKKFIGTNKTDSQLGIDGHPETMSRPKEKIEEAIRIGREDLPKKIRKNVTIEELYSILGESISVNDLLSFKSYKDFQGNIKSSLTRMNLLN